MNKIQKKYQNFYIRKSRYSYSFSKREKNVKNLNDFLKIDKCDKRFVKSGSGIRFLLNFRSKLFTEIFISTINLIYLSFLGYYCNNKIVLVNSFVRYNDQKKKLKTFFLKNFSVKKTYLSKIFIEESSDQIKTYLDEKLIRLILKIDRTIGRCWLWVNSTTYNNKKFWYHLISSFFTFMTTIESVAERPYPIQDLNAMLKKLNIKDYDLEFSKIFEKKTTLFENYDQLKIHPMNFKFLLGYYKSLKIKNYLKNLNWRNRFFQNTHTISKVRSVRMKKISHSSYLLLI